MNERVQRFLLELIEADKWDEAKWIEVAFMVAQNAPPMLCFVFKHPDRGKEIFAGLRAKMTRDDEEELLRIVIVEGVAPENPNAFVVKIGPHMGHVLRRFGAEVQPGAEPETYVAMSRFKRTNPNKPFPLFAVFKEHVHRDGEFKIIPAAWINGSLVPFVDLSVRKREILFRHRSEIAPGDQDANVLKAG